MGDSVRYRTIREEGETEDLIRTAKTGDLIKVCQFECSSDITTTGEMLLNWKPCRRGVIQFVEEVGFFLNGRKMFSFTCECRDWFPYRGGEIVVMTDHKLIRLFYGKAEGSTEMTEQQEVIHQNGEIMSCEPHLATESILVDDKNVGTLLIKRFAKKIGTVDRTKMLASKVWAATRNPRSLGDIKLMDLYWKKSFATKHIQPLVVPHNYGQFSMNDKHGIVCLIEGKKFIRVFPDIEETVFEATHDYSHRKWEVCGGNILNKEDARVYFNDATDNPAYVGRYNDVLLAGNYCLIKKGAELYLPFRQEKPLATIEIDDERQHPSGLVYRRGTVCYLLIVHE